MGLQIIITTGLTVLVGVIQFAVGLNGNGTAILLTGLLMGWLPHRLCQLCRLWKPSESGSDSDWNRYLPACASITGIALGGMGSWVVRDSGMERLSVSTGIYLCNWLAIGIGASVNGLFLYREWRLVAWRCGCGRHMPGRNPRYCPQHGYWVCARCWREESLGCVDCEGLKPPPPEFEADEWWDDRVGLRLTGGQCSRCDLDADERDLRGCGSCTWPMCTDCWDMENGSCVRCSWVIPGLRGSLAGYHLVEISSSRRRE